MYKKILVIGIVFLFTFGCAAFKNLNMQDVRAEEYLMQTGDVKYSVTQIDNFINKYNYNCNGTAKLTFDGEDKSKGSIVTYGMGFTQANPYFIVDFTDTDNGATYKAYSVYQVSHKTSLNKLLGIIEREGRCE